MKRPSFQFYPADWAGNSNLKRCTHEEKGIWMDVMCILHDQEEYGVARWTAKELAQAVGCSLPKLKSLINKGILKGADSGQQTDGLIYVPRSGRKNGAPVTLVDPQSGPIWFSSRMVIDEYKRVIRGGEYDSSKGTPNPSPKGGIGEGIDDTPKGTPDPSPSRARPSSTSSSSSTPTGLKEKTNKKENADTDEPVGTDGVCSPPGVVPVETDKPPPPGKPTDIPIDPPPVSPYGAICAYVRSQQMLASPSDQTFRDLVDSGATMQHFIDAVAVAQNKGKGWGYMLGIVRNMLLEAQAPPRAAPRKQTSSTHDSWDRINEKLRNQQEADHVIDGEITVVDDKQSHG